MAQRSVVLADFGEQIESGDREEGAREEDLYNLFVPAQDGAWDGRGYEYDRGRFLEYTPDELVDSFKDLKSRQLEALVALPCLFAYEGKEPMRVGKLKTIKLRGRSLFIDFELDDAALPIPFNDIDPLRRLLDIRDWEMSRTHWAVKDEDLFKTLLEAGLLPQGAAEPLAVEQRPAPEPPESQVNSVGAFVTTVLALKKKGKEVFYRGHSSKARYRLEPSVFRKNSAGDYIHLDKEDRMYRELLVTNSSDFQGDVYSLDRLVRMQHYSLPTRLLDITSNPLIALYFACPGRLRLRGSRRLEIVRRSLRRPQRASAGFAPLRAPRPGQIAGCRARLGVKPP